MKNWKNTDQRIEFDPIAICCDWEEYKDLDEFKMNINPTDYDFEACVAYSRSITVGDAMHHST